MKFKRFLKNTTKTILKLIGAFNLLFLYLLIALYARLFKKNKSFDVAIGMLPLINNIYHKKAMEIYGYKVKTLIFDAYFITDEFDYQYNQTTFFSFYKYVKYFFELVTKYNLLYTYFDGTWCFFRGLPPPIAKIFIYLEPRILKLAGLKLVLMPYGGDVHDMNFTKNLLFKHNLSKDYPLFQRKTNNYIKNSVSNWLKYADHVISGCDWVYYMHSWDTLLSGHFSIDTHKLKPSIKRQIRKGDLIKVFHSPNHSNIKGTKHFEEAINNLKQQGYNLELVFVQRLSNDKILNLMNECDIVADQLIIGWYAMTALEAMCFAKPVLCYLNDELIDFYDESGILNREELPFINCNFKNVESQLKQLLDHLELIEIYGNKSRAFVEKYHSLEYIGGIFDRINRQLNVNPTNAT